MLNDIVNITLYLYSSTTIVFVLMKSSQRRRLALTPALREKKKNKQTNHYCPVSVPYPPRIFTYYRVFQKFVPIFYSLKFY